MEFYNRRKFHRIHFDGHVSLDFIHGSYNYCPIRNLSLTGLFVEGEFLSQDLTNCFITLFHDDKTGNNSLQATARVVRRSDDGIGLKFINMTLENYELLQTTLSIKAENPLTILREVPSSYPFEVSYTA